MHRTRSIHRGPPPYTTAATPFTLVAGTRSARRSAGDLGSCHVNGRDGFHVATVHDTGQASLGPALRPFRRTSSWPYGKLDGNFSWSCLKETFNGRQPSFGHDVVRGACFSQSLLNTGCCGILRTEGLG